MISLHIDRNFEKDMLERINSAERRVYVQFMTFEGDIAGKKLARALINAQNRGLDVKVIIDAFTDKYVSDTHHRNKSVKAEVISTKRMIAKLRDNNILVFRTRPYAPLRIGFLFRNHKKIVVIDNCSYLGGINVSDHNYSWHDLMVRFDSIKITNTLAKDFMFTAQGKHTHLTYGDNPKIVTGKYLYKEFKSLLKSAKKSLIISSPYALDLPFLRVLGKVSKKTKITLLLPKKSNISLFRLIDPFMRSSLNALGVEIKYYSRFSHAKFIIVDDYKMLIGSSNFGHQSFVCNDEIGAIIEDKKFVKESKRILLSEKFIEVKFTNNKAKIFGAWIISWIMYLFVKVYAWFFRIFSRNLSKRSSDKLHKR